LQTYQPEKFFPFEEFEADIDVETSRIFLGNLQTGFHSGKMDLCYNLEDITASKSHQNSQQSQDAEEFQESQTFDVMPLSAVLVEAEASPKRVKPHLKELTPEVIKAFVDIQKVLQSLGPVKLETLSIYLPKYSKRDLKSKPLVFSEIYI
jgi:hypothetical protein